MAVFAESYGGVALKATGRGAGKLEIKTESQPCEPIQQAIQADVPQASPIESQNRAEDIETPPFSPPQAEQKAVKGAQKVEEDENDDGLSSIPESNIHDSINKLALGTGFKPSDVDTDPTNALQNLKSLIYSVRTAAVRFKGGRPSKQEQLKDITRFLYILSCFTTVTPEFSKELKLKGILELFINPDTKFPQDYVLIGQALIDKIEAQNGFVAHFPPPISSMDTQPVDVNGKNGRFSENDTAIPSKRPRESSASGPSLSSASSNSLSRLPRSDHFIWGRNGCMRGMYLAGSTISTVPQTRYKEDFHVYGHNGLKVGDNWFCQLTALRDGAHGASQGGISGDKDNGAYSIVISSHYDGFDRDLGKRIYYSAPGARESISKTPDSNKTGTKAMRQSLITRNPVRVLRNSTCNWAGGPAMGLRYDGLYRVTQEEVKANAGGGRFWLFTLIRLSGQIQIQTNRPSRAEIGIFERVKDGY